MITVTVGHPLLMEQIYAALPYTNRVGEALPMEIITVETTNHVILGKLPTHKY